MGPGKNSKLKQRGPTVIKTKKVQVSITKRKKHGILSELSKKDKASAKSSVLNRNHSDWKHGRAGTKKRHQVIKKLNISKYTSPSSTFKGSAKQFDHEKQLEILETIQKDDVIAVTCDDPDYEFYLILVQDKPFTVEVPYKDGYGCSFAPGSVLVRGQYLMKVDGDKHFYKLEDASRLCCALTNEVICTVPLVKEGGTRSGVRFLLDEGLYNNILDHMLKK